MTNQFKNVLVNPITGDLGEHLHSKESTQDSNYTQKSSLQPAKIAPGLQQSKLMLASLFRALLSQLSQDHFLI